jgi:hypothetical protein
VFEALIAPVCNEVRRAEVNGRPSAVTADHPLGDPCRLVRSVLVIFRSHWLHRGVLDIQQEEPRLNLACTKPVHLRVMWEAGRTGTAAAFSQEILGPGSAHRIFLTTSTY